MCAGYNGAAKGTRILFLNTEILPAISSLPVVNQYYERMLPWKPASILTIRYPRCLADMEETQLAIAISSADTSQQQASQPAATPQTEAIAPGSSTLQVPSDDTKDDFPYRLEVLYEPTITPTVPVQIVFVHGLNGSKRETWTHSNKQFWPAWLHDEKGLENVRILTFGYNSSTNVLKPNTNLSIPSFANQLLLYLSQLNYQNESVNFLDLGGTDSRWQQRYS